MENQLENLRAMAKNDVMATEKQRLDAIRKARLSLQNPYAYLEYLDESVEEPARTPLHRTENPWASLASWDGSEDSEARVSVVEAKPASPPSSNPARPLKEYLSKADFRSECHRIFLPYVPPHLPRRIPQHQRDFISRNERRSGKSRYRLLAGLSRYDLSTTPSISPQFNREHSDDLSDRKLRQIEAQVSDED